MRIENIDKENIKELVPVELRNTKLRFIHIYENHFSDPTVEKAVGLTRHIFINKYIILRNEMKSRGVEYMEDSPLDKVKEVNIRSFLKSIYGIDVPDLAKLEIVKSYVAISGAFMKMPKTAKQVDVVVRNVEENKDVALEKKIAMVIKAHTGKEPNFIYRPEGPNKTYMPVFDLVLKACDDVKVIKITEPVVIEKGAIPYKDLGTAEEATAWAGAKETVKADVEDLRQICAWYDSANPDIKGSYKLPHHRMSDKKAVWRAVYAAMAALLGARGGVKIPAGDKKGVYNHLAAHYKQFDKEAPELKSDAEALKKAFPIEKPEESETTIRIPVGDECAVTATITISADEGIKALYCGKIKKIRTYLFDKRIKAWTMATAKAWVKEHHTEKLEKKISEAAQKEYDEETAKIRENAKGAKYPHKFKVAKWTWPNGHPRCIHCGEEELIDNKPCERPVAKFNISKIDKKQQIVGGVVYEPDEIDTQGDYADAKEIEKAQIRFMEKYATDTKRVRISHKGKKLFFPIVESFIPEHDTIKGDKPLKVGSWWLEMKVTNTEVWKLIEDGTLTGFSMGGRAKA